MSNDPTTHEILLVGMPGTGKTTFLAALWDLVEGGSALGSLDLQELTEGNYEYLNSIREKWLRCEECDRTERAGNQAVSLRLVDLEDNEVVNIHLPDISGEQFKEQWEERITTQEYQAVASRTNGIILFIHPERVDDIHRIDETTALINEIEGALDEGQILVEQSDPPVTPDPEVPWTYSESRYQAKVIELIQFVDLALDNPNVFRIAVIISAWDLIEGSNNISPMEWLESQLPLLLQYLHANSDKSPYRIYGVSAQGGAYTKEMIDVLTGHLRPAMRIRVIGRDCRPNDIAAPIRFIIGK